MFIFAFNGRKQLTAFCRKLKCKIWYDKTIAKRYGTEGWHTKDLSNVTLPIVWAGIVYSV